MAYEQLNGYLIRIRNLTKTRGDSFHLDIENLSIRSGEKIAIHGASGSGKSTCLDILALVLRPDRADCFQWSASGRPLDLLALWERKQANILAGLRRNDLGYVLQTGALIPFLNIRDNIMLTAALKGLPISESRRKLEELYDVLGIGHLGGSYPDSISVGERQRCAIARAIIHHPALLVADEPTASLDPDTADRVFELLLSLSAKTALVVATHDLDRIEKQGFKTYRIISYGPSRSARMRGMKLIEDSQVAER